MIGDFPQFRVALEPRAPERTDSQLLEAFIADRQDAAFEILLRRHGPMVMGVCRRILRGWHDAEDAFQATFLVLARKAEYVVPREMLANWLYGVAHQTALKLRAMLTLRAMKERSVAKTSEPELVPSDDALWGELRPFIDEELSHLPEKYRMPIVLCDLEEQSYKDAAAQLGWPEGTLAGRLSRARALLAGRLARRGIALSTGALAQALQQGASARVPSALIPSIVKAAAVVAGPVTAGAVSPNVAALTEAVLRGMAFPTFKVVTAVLVAVIGIGAGVAFAGNRVVAPESVVSRTEGRVVPHGGDARPRPGATGTGADLTVPLKGKADATERETVRRDEHENGEDEKRTESSARDALLPVTIITSAVREGGRLRVRGSVAHTSDIKNVLVNGLPARSTRGSYAEWEIVIDAPAGQSVNLTAVAEDVQGHAEKTPHTIRAD